ncbi:MULTISPECIES: nucleotide pyrophosphatase/phosphodiesterase family protein [unclassified Arthrobacter]|uniref:alkaline phosphatase family protein n=1 Tax=unclassified Arthrobacter TaxID=235627 RepID=UPI0024DF6570|nr:MULTISPECIES: nucleotide pyrophosphatase/phosphodiesterase family protein [unclassified Arthrobacter]MCC9145102.1 alkaline phosphatase family protein [Arthrobacter sp. zg-Y919]MDK1276330.1 alkaline phosphatase family protein [Arthrobacter sp. zg.Y919]WIB02066.1 alkaline phosphatase family protein [Arthrobacter sp. zg-Y919]
MPTRSADTVAAIPSVPESLPAAPAYGNRSVADVLSSAAAVLGVPGYENRLSLPAARRVCVVMVDGLGLSLLRKRAGHAPFLKGFLPTARTLSASFPTTTVASLASLGTGLAPGRHGLVGYDVLDPEQDKVVNMLGSWDAGVDPLKWQPYPTILEKAAEHLPVATVSLPRFAESPLTRAALRGGTFIPATGVHARVSAAVDALAGADSMLMYLYWNELDKAGHRYGAASTEWGNELEELDSALKRLVARVPAGTLVLLTADHGMVDVPVTQRFDFSTQPALIDGVRHTAGEPRMVHLYLQPDAGSGALDRLKAAWQAAYGTRAWVFTRDEAVQAGYFGPGVDAAVLPRIGDLMIAAREPIALFDTRRVAATALDVTGQHGSLTRAECEVPLLVLAQPEQRKNKSSTTQGGK